jgi:hypothetical protein
MLKFAVPVGHNYVHTVYGVNIHTYWGGRDEILASYWPASKKFSLSVVHECLQQNRKQ